MPKATKKENPPKMEPKPSTKSIKKAEKTEASKKIVK